MVGVWYVRNSRRSQHSHRRCRRWHRMRFRKPSSPRSKRSTRPFRERAPRSHMGPKPPRVRDLDWIGERARDGAKGVYPAHRSQKGCALGSPRDLLDGTEEGSRKVRIPCRSRLNRSRGDPNAHPFWDLCAGYTPFALWWARSRIPRKSQTIIDPPAAARGSPVHCLPTYQKNRFLEFQGNSVAQEGYRSKSFLSKFPS